MRKVDFLIAGVQKGGTTALHNYLTQNPFIFMPSKKELHFFDDETIKWNEVDYTDYHSNFDGACLNQKMGEATPIYTFWPHALERIAIYNKDIKLIICLRNPTERAYSAWSMVTSMQKEDMPFSVAIKQGRERINNDLARRLFTYVERGFYAEQIQKAIELFSASQIFILQQKELLEQHDRSLRKICDFLGVKHVPTQHKFIRPIEAKKGLPLISDTDRAYLNTLYAVDCVKTEKLIKFINKL